MMGDVEVVDLGQDARGLPFSIMSCMMIAVAQKLHGDGRCWDGKSGTGCPRSCSTRLPTHDKEWTRDCILHPLIGNEVAGVLEALYLVGSANMAIVSFNMLTGLKEVMQDLAKSLGIIEGTSRVGALYPHKVPTQNTRLT